jgi:putative membrane protein
MFNKLFIVAGASALVLAACGQRSETDTAEQATTPDAMPSATVPTPANEAAAPDFVAKAAASDMFEIESSKLALEKATNAEVKAFAQQMIDAHTATTADLKNAIADSGQAITPPAALPAELQDEITDMQGKTGADFDKDYMDEQVDAHQNALNLLQRYANDGDVAQIKAFAAATAPKVQQHYDMATALRDKNKSGLPSPLGRRPIRRR